MAGTTPWIRSTWTDAGQIAAIVDPENPPGDAAGQPLHVWHAALLDKDDPGAALEFMAHALSRYDCVAWATRAAIATGVVERTDPLIVAVLQWIDNPDDPLRRAAGDLADKVKADSPAKLLCLAVWFSGGSLSRPELPSIQPPPEVCARLAAAALLVGAHAKADPDKVLGEILELGEAMVTAQ